ncbi:uncharacterized protein [Primulina huaijiensis]|uniref:uncharacterized protein n=1 Tax=Primulina huaijiensis TaxID=1492673 RepID=UPI003CC6ED88
MAIEVFPDSQNGRKSPRISFSHDLPQTDLVPIEQHIGSGPASSSNNDFNFCAYRASFDQESSSADELFSGGKIITTEIKKKLSPSRTSYAPPPPPPPPPPPFRPPPPPLQCLEVTENKSLSAKAFRLDAESEDKEQNHKPSFWSFKRSTSLNCSSGYARRFCSLPVFARSYSTGSADSAKRSAVSNNPKQNIAKYSPNMHWEKPKSASCTANHQRPPLKKNKNSSNNGIKVNPVLHIPLANIFGLGSIFSGGKDKNKKKY